MLTKDRKYLRAKPAAKYFNVSKETMWRWVRDKPDFPKPIKMAERVTLFDITAIEEWMRAKQ